MSNPILMHNVQFINFQLWRKKLNKSKNPYEKCILSFFKRNKAGSKRWQSSVQTHSNKGTHQNIFTLKKISTLPKTVIFALLNSYWRKFTEIIKEIKCWRTEEILAVKRILVLKNVTREGHTISHILLKRKGTCWWFDIIKPYNIKNVELVPWAV